MRSLPDRSIRVRALAGDIVLCSWTSHLTFTVSLLTPRLQLFEDPEVSLQWPLIVWLTLVCNFLMPQHQALGCSSSPCQNGGKCIDMCPLVPPSFRCECEEFYFGDVCQNWTGNTKLKSKPSRLLVPRFQNESSYHNEFDLHDWSTLSETHINGSYENSFWRRGRK